MASKPLSVEERRRLRRFRTNLFRWLCGLGFVVLLGWGVSPFVKLGFNATDSVDGTVFLIVKDSVPPKGGLVAFWPPENDFYHNIWFVKYLKGVPGDRVDWQERLFFINGESIGIAKPASRNGVALRPSEGGVIPKGFYFVWTPHADSFDSRYEPIGWIPRHRLIGRAFRLL
jgi:conjugal transfer pilin signal peptidase TrbI